jgi:hypothetical protein
MTVITPQNMQGGSRMAPEAERVKDVSWEIDQKHYVIRNVPFKVYEEYSDEEVYNSDVTLKLLILKDLMESDEIPSDIDFRKAMKIQ